MQVALEQVIGGGNYDRNPRIYLQIKPQNKNWKNLLFKKGKGVAILAYHMPGSRLAQRRRTAASKTAERANLRSHGFLRNSTFNVGPAREHLASVVPLRAP